MPNDSSLTKLYGWPTDKLMRYLDFLKLQKCKGRLWKKPNEGEQENKVQREH